MNKNRLSNIFLVAALALMAALILQGAIATSKVALASGDSHPDSSAPLCEDSAVERSSIRRVYVEQMDSWLTYTDGAPTGLDGGLIYLLSHARACSG
jgi:hypothetical protein